ncbi:MAG: beta-trefoil DNA-binding domain-containing protein, partial [Linnemannia elongata]
KKTTVTCYHAAVAQKSYGSEKRFLCPPPFVQIQGNPSDSNSAALSKVQVAMSVICESGENSPLGQRSTLEDDQSSTFRYLYVSGTAKAKSFKLKIQSDADLPEPCATFDSQPITIISKPSKKTAKARNVSSCILAGSLVSLFNRINSQTVRTKYMSAQDGELCAKGSTWSAFTISIVANGPTSPSPSRNGAAKSHHRQPVQPTASPITYGAEIILTETSTGLQSDRLIVCKVENGRIIEGAIGPICQMQKVALQSTRRSADDRPLYLGAGGDDHQGGRFMDHTTATNTVLRYEPTTKPEYYRPGSDDFLCWTIVGI